MASTSTTAGSAASFLSGQPEPALFLIHDLRPGGAERVFLNYVRSLHRFRPVPVLVRREIELLDGVSPTSILDLGPARSRTQRARSMPVEIAFGATALAVKARKLRGLAARNQARLVSTFLHKSHIIALTAKLFLEPRLRVVINVHELPSQHLEHHFAPPQRRIMAWFTRRYFPRADVIVAVAEGIKRDLIDSFGIPAERIVVVPNPIDIAQIQRRAREPVDWPAPTPISEPSGPMLVAVGRLVKLKGFDLLLRAFTRLPVALQASLTFIGEGEEQPVLAALATELGVADRVHFIGQQDNPWKYMARSDLLVLSSFTEGFPNVLGEAMALGLPIVATDCSPGVREYLEDGRAGILVPPKDVMALSAGLERMLTDQALRAQLKAYGPERVRAFDLPRIIERYEAVLERACRATPPSPLPAAPARVQGRSS